MVAYSTTRHREWQDSEQLQLYISVFSLLLCLQNILWKRNLHFNYLQVVPKKGYARETKENTHKYFNIKL